MSRYVEHVADWERLIYREGTPPKREGQHLDFKKDLHDGEKTAARADEKMALVIASFANADGGVIAYGAVEDEDAATRIKVCVGTNNLLGDMQENERRIRNVIKSHLYGIEPLPDIRPLPLPNGDRVIAVNVRPSVSLVAVTTPADDVRMRYPVRDGEGKVYLQPQQVEQRILSYRARAARIQLERFGVEVNPGTTPLPKPTPTPVHLLHVREGTACPVMCEPGGVRTRENQPKTTDAQMMELRGDLLRLRLTRETPSNRECFVEVPCDWVATTWLHQQSKDHMVMPAVLIAAEIIWNTLKDQATLAPRQWLR